jgi:predicted permease
MLQQVRVSGRSLLRARGFTLTAVLTLGLAAGSAAAVAAVIYAVLLKPLPYRDPHQLVAVWPDRFQSNADLVYLRGHGRMFTSLAAVAPGWSMSLHDAGSPPARVTVARTSGNLFSTLGVTPAIGRTFDEEHARPGAPTVAVLSHAFWRRHFGGDPAVVGRVVRLDGEAAEIIGVMPADFEVFGLRQDAYAPFPIDTKAWYHAVTFSLLVGRLQPGMTAEAADRDYRALIPGMRADRGYAESYGQTARVESLQAAVAGTASAPLLVLGAAVSVILLIAGTNVGTLLLTRAAGRRRELAVRTAIGATRGRLATELLTEGALVAVAGGFLGLGLARMLLPSFVRLLPVGTPRTAEIALDPIVSAAVVLAATVIGLACAAAPVALTLRLDMSELLRTATGSEPRQGRRLRASLVSVEIALALLLAVAAGLMVQTLRHLHRVAPGFDAGPALTMHVQPSGEKLRGASVADYYDRLLDRLRVLPGVEAAGAIQHLPFSGYSWNASLDIEGIEVAPGAAKPVAGLRIATSGYFQALGQPLLAGRGLERPDVSGTSVVVNETFARTHFGSVDRALGRTLRISGGRLLSPWMSVIGVVADVRHRGLTDPVLPEIYTSVGHSTIPAMMVVVRASGDSSALVPAVRAAIWSVDPDVPISDIETMRTKIDGTLGQPRLLVALLTGFAVVGVALAAIGVYGVVAYAAARRRREIGIKLALGAGRGRLVREVVGDGLVHGAAGVAAGLIAAVAAREVIRAVLVGVSPTDPLTYAVVGMATMAVVGAACAVPAWRAARTAPTSAMREN